MLDYKSLIKTVEAIREKNPELYVKWSIELHKIEAIKETNHRLLNIEKAIEGIR